MASDETAEVFPHFPPRRRKAHVWKVRRDGFRDFIVSHRWTPCGAFARKVIRGHEYLMFPAAGYVDHHRVRITAKDDHEFGVRAPFPATELQPD